MSKSDDAQQAAQDVREQVFRTGRPVAELIKQFAPEWSVEPHVVEAWVLRDPNFASLAALDEAVAEHHRSVAEYEASQAELIRQRELKYSELADLIDLIPQSQSALVFATLNTMGFAHAQNWRDWIKKNCWEPKIDRQDAFAFARARLEARRNYGN